MKRFTHFPFTIRALQGQKLPSFFWYRQASVFVNHYMYLLSVRTHWISSFLAWLSKKHAVKSTICDTSDLINLFLLPSISPLLGPHILASSSFSERRPSIQVFSIPDDRGLWINYSAPSVHVYQLYSTRLSLSLLTVQIHSLFAFHRPKFLCPARCSSCMWHRTN
jgi:hypothetical protein